MGMPLLHNSQKDRVLYGSLTDLTHVLRTNVLPVPRVLSQGRTELTEGPRSGMNVVHPTQKFRVRTGMVKTTM